MTHKEWPFIEAQRILDRLAEGSGPSVTAETGYGPSGLPHIGTFGEVARTSFVLQALATRWRRGSDVAHHRLLRRHGRPARRAEEPPQRADAAAAPRQAPHLHPGPLRRGEVLRPLHEQEAARVPGLLRVPLRVRLVHGAVRLRRVRRGPAPDHAATTTPSASCSRPPSRRRSAPRGARSSPSARTAAASTPRGSRGWTRPRAPCTYACDAPLAGKYECCGHAGTAQHPRRRLQGGLEGGLGPALVLPRASTTRCTARTCWIPRGCRPGS